MLLHGVTEIKSVFWGDRDLYLTAKLLGCVFSPQNCLKNISLLSASIRAHQPSSAIEILIKLIAELAYMRPQITMMLCYTKYI